MSAVLISSSTISTSPVQAVSLPSAATPSTTTAKSAVAAAASTGEVRGNFQPADPRASFLPAMSQSAYATEKAAAARAPRRPKQQPASAVASPSVAGPSLAEPTAIAPTVVGQNFRGIDQPKACACGPSDAHGVVGPSHYVQIVNSRIVMYNKSTRAIVKSASLNSFFNYTGAGSKMVFDPRAAYDAVAQRYIFTGAAFLESNNNQYFFIAVSKTSSPTGAFWVYKLLVNGGKAGVFFDYPQLGMDKNAVLVTANVFGIGSKVGTPYFFKKSGLYNGTSFKYSSFPNLTEWTLASTRVLDENNPTTFMVSAPGSGKSITKLGFKGTASGTPILTEDEEIPVTSFTMAPDALQPGTNAMLDTLDSRFVDSSTQFGNRLFNTHTVARDGHPAPMFYEFDTSADTATSQSGFFGASGTSDDWNASLAANLSGEVFVTYSSTDSAVKPQVRVSAKPSADAYIPAGIALTTSSTVFTTPSLARWGDYSSTTLDPSAADGCAANRRAWGTNQIVIGGPTWGSQIGRFGFC